MAPAKVANIYRELRWMSRLWCWMKCLKWAGYGSTTKNVSDVSAGQLTIFCLACPQPGINIPDNWIDDPSRQVVKCWLIGHDLFYYTAGVRGPLIRSYLRTLSYSIFISNLRLYSRRVSYFPHYSIPSP